MTAANAWLGEGTPLRADAPHRRAGSTHRHIQRIWIVAAGLVGLSGIAFFGWQALMVITVSVASTFGVDLAFVLASRRASAGRMSRTFLIGMIVGLTLPATVAWYIPAIAGGLSALVGNVIFGGWLHPALIGRVLVQFIFWNKLSTLAVGTGAVLMPGHIFTGDIDLYEPAPYYDGWLEFNAGGKNAVEIHSPQTSLREFAEGDIPGDGDLHFEPLLRDILPPWRDAVIGAVPGGIGETSVAVLLVVGFMLIYKGYLKWQLPAAILISAFVTVSILPVIIDGRFSWFPVFAVENGRAVGLAYCVYHLTAGQLMLVAFLIAGDSVSSPMRVQGHIVFGIGIGVITIFMRLYGVLECEAYWAVLIMNAFVSSIDRLTRRRTLGTVANDAVAAS